jgi:hypothetical protein
LNKNNNLIILNIYNKKNKKIKFVCHAEARDWRGSVVGQVAPVSIPKQWCYGIFFQNWVMWVFFSILGAVWEKKSYLYTR